MLNFPQFGQYGFPFQSQQNNSQNQNDLQNSGWTAMPVVMMMPAQPPAPQNPYYQPSTASSLSIQDMMMSFLSSIMQLFMPLMSMLTENSASNSTAINPSSLDDSADSSDSSVASDSSSDVVDDSSSSDATVEELIQVLQTLLADASDESVATDDTNVDYASDDTVSEDSADYVDSSVDDSTDSSVEDSADVSDEEIYQSTTTSEDNSTEEETNANCDFSELETALANNSQKLDALNQTVQTLIDEMAADDAVSADTTSPSAPSQNPAGHWRGRGHRNHNAFDISHNTPVCNQPPAYEPPAEEPPAYDLPPAEEPPVYEPPVEEPPVYQPPVEEPPVYQPPVEEPPYCPPTNVINGSAGLNGDPKFMLFTPGVAANHPDLASFESGLQVGDNESLLKDTDQGGFEVDANGVQVDPATANSVGVGSVHFTVNGHDITADAQTGNIIVDGDMAFNIEMDGLISSVDLGNGASFSTAMKIDDAQGNQAERIVIRNGEYEVTMALRKPHPDAKNYFDINFEELIANAADNATGFQAANGVGIADLLALES